MSQNNRRYSESSCAGGTYYYFSRNIPHPRMVCHMPGLNNALICVVRSSFSQEHPSAGNTVIPQQEVDQEEHVLTGNTRSNSRNLPRLKGFLRGERGISRPTTQGHADLPERIQSEPTSSEKLLKKRFQASAQPASRQGICSVSVTQPSSPSVNLCHGPHVQQNVNVDLSYLDQDIKVLGKLGQVLQMDSLTEIQKWFARASTEEKDFVSSMIFSEPTDKGMLNSKEGTAEHINTQTLLKPLPSLQRGPEEKKNQSRSSSWPSVASRNMKWEREKLLLSTLRNTGPAHCPQGRTATEKAHGDRRQVTILPSRSSRSLACATATPKQQISPFQWRPFTYKNM